MLIFLKFLLFLWCLPQNIVGFIYSKIMHKSTMYLFSPEIGKVPTKNIYIKFVRFIKAKILNNKYYFIENKRKMINFGVSLGNYICIYCKSIDDFSSKDIQHENGHRVQSIILGPFYLIFVGFNSLFSFILNALILSKKYDKKTLSERHHKVFVESWADKLGSY